MVINLRPNKFSRNIFLLFSLGSFFFISCSFAQVNQSIKKINFDNYGRLIDYTDKIEVACPNQDEKTGVLFVIGQSNACNTGEKKFTTRYPTQVFNYYQGKCYIASSPIIGPGGTYTGGEFMTPLADELIDNGAYQAVIIIATGVPGSAIKSWEKGAIYNNMMLSIVSDLASTYKITDVIWHQGESDCCYQTTGEQYTKSFNSLVETIRDKVPDTSIYYAIATRCHGGWTPDDPVAAAQRNLANDSERIYLGADTDSLVLDKDRYDHCHFGEQGQLVTAHAFATAIRQHK